MTPRQAVIQILHDIICVTPHDEDVDEFLMRLHNLGFVIVPKALSDK